MHTARLVSATPNAEETIVYCARVSNPSNQENMDTAASLLRYCMKHGHYSIFETASMTVEIETNRAISAQLLRHRSATFQEFSQRYSDVSELPPIELPMLRRQDTKNKQSSHDDLDPEFKALCEKQIRTHYAAAMDLYEHMLFHGVAKETAREILPLGIPTRLYMTNNLRNWIFYLNARCGVETQLEHRMIANAIKGIFEEQFPVIAEAAFA